MGRIILFVVSIVFFVNGVGILSSDECSSVSFDGEGAGRVMVAVCYQGSEGAIPGWVAGLMMVAISIGLMLLAITTHRRL